MSYWFYIWNREIQLTEIGFWLDVDCRFSGMFADQIFTCFCFIYRNELQIHRFDYKAAAGKMAFFSTSVYLHLAQPMITAQLSSAIITFLNVRLYDQVLYLMIFWCHRTIERLFIELESFLLEIAVIQFFINEPTRQCISNMIVWYLLNVFQCYQDIQWLQRSRKIYSHQNRL